MKPSPTHHRAAALVVAILAVLALVRMAPPPVVQLPEAPPPVAPRPTLVDPRTADSRALESLPGVGPALARRIVEARAQRPFTRAEDLLRVRGIGPRTLARMRARLTFPTETEPTDRGASSPPP